MKFFTFSQNNSGGVFTGDAEYIIIEAESAEDANRRAEATGIIYFNGCDKDLDCPCCGDRWSEQWSDKDGDKVPSIYGTPVKDSVRGMFRNNVLIVYANGKQEMVNLKDKQPSKKKAVAKKKIAAKKKAVKKKKM